MMEKKKKNFITLAFLFMMMILAAFVENTKGVFIPGFKEEFGVTDNTISNMLIVTSALYMVLTFIGGTLCEKIGQKKVFIIGLITIFSSLMFLSITDNYWMLLIGLGASSGGLALTAIASNTLLPVIVLSAQTIIMNILHFCYGFGSTIGQGLFGTLTAQGINWRSMYFWTGIVYLIILFAFIFVKTPNVKVSKEKNDIKIMKILTNKTVLGYMLALGLYVFTEQGIGNWFVNYMKYSYDFKDQTTAIYLSTFFAVLAIGRLLGGFVVEKRGYFNVLYKTVFIGAALCLIGLIIGPMGMFMISISGLFFSITFPTTVLTMSKVFKEKSAYITGIILTAVSFISMIMNKLIGLLSEVIGTNKAFFIIPISGILSAILMLYLFKSTKAKLVDCNKSTEEDNLLGKIKK